MRPKVSLVVLNWNGLDLTRNCLKFLKKNTNYGNLESIVIDNGSTDGSYEKLKREFHWARHIRLSQNVGYCGGANTGFRKSRGKYVFIINNDVEVTKNWIAPIIEVMEHNNLIASASPIVLSPGESHKKPNIPYKVVLAPNGAATGYKKQILNKIGLFDEKNFYPAYGEENDWSYKAFNDGYMTVEVQNSIIYHKGSVTTKHEYGSDVSYIMCETHRLKAMLFNLPLVKLIKFVPGLSLIFIRSIVDGKLHLLFHAYLNLFKIFNKILKERKRRLSKIKR